MRRARVGARQQLGESLGALSGSTEGRGDAHAPVAVDERLTDLGVREARGVRMIAVEGGGAARARRSNSIRTVFASRSSFGRRLQMPFDSSSGSMGMTRSGK